MNQLKSENIHVNGIDLHYVHGGEGELLLFLHGFPDFWYIWRHQLPVFSKSWHAVAPDLRGYNLSDKPEKQEDYKMKVLVEDIRQLIVGLGYEKCTLVGHDWGGAVAWAFAYKHPEYLDKLIIFNAPHPVTFARELAENSEQRKASEYIKEFQKEGAAARLMEDDYNVLDQMILKHGKEKGYFTEDDAAKYKESWRNGSMEGMLSYYKNIKQAGTVIHTLLHSLEVPVLVIWGMKDPALLSGNLKGLENHVKDLQIRKVEDAYHSPQQEKPNEVNAAIEAFLRK
ncbi:alpha/beta hydrolase [Metabacillus sp. GX 13764]|uniref:alpha/beta fold hydrolase n=1 Tax=Metabacillus kandeliae TaxID=2900151 RepID=UPI001E5AD99F|nr:alpha/beta hydrolase [Metabacillus kandeliae]MCD7034785.1 alpha/beta hydrolase [Metabacillus kandeliae]